MDLYAENILDHYRHPRHKTLVEGATVSHEEINTSCGDGVTVHLRFKGDVIDAIGWDGQGCAISQAGMSILADELAGKTVGDIDVLSADSVKILLGVPVGIRRAKCAFLGLHALKNAMHGYRGEGLQGWEVTLG